MYRSGLKEIVMSCSGVYGNTKFGIRRDQWSHLADFKCPHDVACLATRDFNDILDHSKKFGGHITSNYKLEHLWDLLHTRELMDLGCMDFKLTWCNLHVGSKRLHKRIDRMLYNVN